MIYIKGTRLSGLGARKGDFTLLRYIQALDCGQLEDRLGFHKGRLSSGGVIAVIDDADLASLTTNDFTLGASTRWSRSRASAPWAPEFTWGQRPGERMEVNAIESSLALRGQDVEGLRKKVLDFIKKDPMNFPAKVFPHWVHKQGMEYPDAEFGLPQFMLHKRVMWKVWRSIK